MRVIQLSLSLRDASGAIVPVFATFPWLRVSGGGDDVVWRLLEPRVLLQSGYSLRPLADGNYQSDLDRGVFAVTRAEDRFENLKVRAYERLMRDLGTPPRNGGAMAPSSLA